MESQDAVTLYFFKAWSWAENNAKRIAVGAGIAIVAVIIVSYYFWQQNQTEITAGEALTQTIISTSPNSDAGQLANAYLKIAADYPGSLAGERALMLGAAALFTSGQYAPAQAQFQKYLDTQPGGPFSAQAALGVATSLDAQGKTDPAAEAYQRVINAFPSDANAVDAAKIGLAKIDEQRGKLSEAENFYQEVARNNPNNLVGTEAAFRAMQLRAKLPATPLNTLPTSFNLNTKP